MRHKSQRERNPNKPFLCKGRVPPTVWEGRGTGQGERPAIHPAPSRVLCLVANRLERWPSVASAPWSYGAELLLFLPHN